MEDTNPSVLANLELEIFFPNCFPSKKVDSHWHPGVPHNACGESFQEATCIGGVKGFNCKGAPPFENRQTRTSSMPPLITCPCNLLSSSSTSPNSQSFIYLVNTGLQQFTSPTYSHIWSTRASLFVAIENNFGKATASCSSPHHLSCQNLTLLPFPTLKPTLLLNPFHPLRIAFQRPTPLSSLKALEHHSPSSSSYFPIITYFQRGSFSKANLKHRFPRRALFREDNFLKGFVLLCCDMHLLHFLIHLMKLSCGSTVTIALALGARFLG